MTTPAVQLRTLTCSRCGMDWQRPRQVGQPPKCCPSCASVPAQRRGGGTGGHGDGQARIDPTSPAYRLALATTTYRLAIEEATAALRMGSPALALAALERVAAPGH